MRFRMLLLLAALVAAAAPASASAAAGVRVLGAQFVKGDVAVKLRCEVASVGPCKVRIVADAGGWATGTRTALVDSGQVRTVRVGVARTKRGGAAVADGRVRLVVTARQGTRRLGRPYRRVVRSSSTFGAPLINRFDGRAGSTRVRVQFTSTTTCQRRVTLRGLVQRADAVEVDLVDEGYAAEAPICGQAFTNHCVEFTLDQQLGTRSVWVATASGLQSPAPRGTLPGSFGPEAWERCVPIAVGGSAAA